MGAAQYARWRCAPVLLALGLALLGLLAPPAQGQAPAPAGARSTKTSATGPASPKGPSLVLVPAVEPVLTDNFNPFDSRSPLEAMGVPSYSYEPLLEPNDLQVNQYYPWLAQSWSFSTSGQTLTFTLRKGVTWADGSPLTAADVAYTFNLLRANPALAHGIPIVSAVATNPTTFTLTLSEPGYAYLYDIALVPIVKVGFAKGQDPATFVVKAPDGTGPYALARASDASRDRVVLTARAKYWQKGPSIPQLVFPAYKAASTAQAALLAGKVDWADTFMPDVQSFEQKDKAFNHFWGPPIDCVALVPNLSRYPLDQLAVREAVSVSIGRDQLSNDVTGGVDPPATSSSALVMPTDASFISTAHGSDINGAPQAALAQRIMTSAGFRMGTGGFWQGSTGKALGFTITAQAGTTSYAEALDLARQLRAAGFSVSAQGLDATSYDTAVANGSPDATISTGEPAPTPYNAYAQWLTAKAATPVSSSGAPEVNPALADLADYRDHSSSSSQAHQAISTLASYVSSQLPILPLLYGVAWGEFSTRHASGWPSASNPYEPATPSAPFAEYTVLQLTAVG